MELPLYIVQNRKIGVSGPTRSDVINPEESLVFYRDDKVDLDIFLMEDRANATAELPFQYVNEPNLSLVVSVGNGISGTGRIILAATSIFTDAGSGTEQDPTHYIGTLSFATEAVGAYLTHPEPWDKMKPDYAVGAEVYWQNEYFRAKVANPETGLDDAPDTNVAQWERFDIEREPLYLEVQATVDGKPRVVFRMSCQVVDSVIQGVQTPPPDVEDPDAARSFTDSMAARLQDTASIYWKRAATGIPEFVADVAYDYQSVTWDPIASKYRQSLRRIGPKVQAVSTTPIDVSAVGNGSTVGGVVLANGNLVLLVGQTNAAENRVWVSGSGQLTPATGMGYETGMVVPGPSTGYWITTEGAITEGVTAIAWESAYGTGSISQDELAYWHSALESYTVVGAYSAAVTYSLGQVATSGNQYFVWSYKANGIGKALTNRLYWAELKPFAGAGNNLYPHVRRSATLGNQLQERPDGLYVPAPPTPVVPQLSSDDPTEQSVGSEGAPGASDKASRADHEHPMPGLATSSAPGFMSAADKAKLDALAASSVGSITAGFNGAVHTLLFHGNGLFVGGAFTTYGNKVSGKLARLLLEGTLDTNFSVGNGFDQTVSYLSIAGDGDLLVATTTSQMNYKAYGQALVWKLQLKDADPDENFTCPDPIATSGAETLLGIQPAGSGRLVFLTPNTFRVTDLTGAQLVVETGTDAFKSILGLPGENDVLLSSRAYSAASVAQTFAGIANPKGLKRISVDEGPNYIPAEFLTCSGGGAECSLDKMVLGVSASDFTPYAVVGALVPATQENGVDHSWAGGSSTLFNGLFKIYLNGDAVAGFDVDIVMAASGFAPIPFFVDSAENIYFGGNVSSINGNTVTPWRVYVVSKAGAYVRQFTGFNERVRCGQLISDNLLVFGGDFTDYGGQSVGYLAFLTDTGSLVFNPSQSDGFRSGRVVTVDSLPSSPTSAQRFNLYIMRVNGILTPHLWDEDTQTFRSLWDLQPNATLDVRLPLPVFDPVTGTAVPGGTTSVGVSVPGYGAATVYYTTDGSAPTRNSTQFTGTPIAVATPALIRAFAVLDGYRDSLVATAQYDTSSLTALPQVTFSPTEATPIPNGGSLSVILTVAGHGDATIYYRDKFRTSAWSSASGTVSISVTVDTTIEAYATKSGYAESLVKAQRYNVPNPLEMPILVPTYSGNKLTGWSVSCPGADRIFYRVDPPDQLGSFGYWDHELETDRGHNNGQVIDGSSGTIVITPVSPAQRGVRVFGSSSVRGLSPMAKWNIR